MNKLRDIFSNNGYIGTQEGIGSKAILYFYKIINFINKAQKL